MSEYSFIVNKIGRSRLAALILMMLVDSTQSVEVRAGGGGTPKPESVTDTEALIRKLSSKPDDHLGVFLALAQDKDLEGTEYAEYSALTKDTNFKRESDKFTAFFKSLGKSEEDFKRLFQDVMGKLQTNYFSQPFEQANQFEINWQQPTKQAGLLGLKSDADQVAKLKIANFILLNPEGSKAGDSVGGSQSRDTDPGPAKITEAVLQDKLQQKQLSAKEKQVLLDVLNAADPAPKNQALQQTCGLSPDEATAIAGDSKLIGAVKKFLKPSGEPPRPSSSNDGSGAGAKSLTDEQKSELAKLVGEYQELSRKKPQPSTAERQAFVNKVLTAIGGDEGLQQQAFQFLDIQAAKSSQSPGPSGSTPSLFHWSSSTHDFILGEEDEIIQAVRKGDDVETKRLIAKRLGPGDLQQDIDAILAALKKHPAAKQGGRRDAEPVELSPEQLKAKVSNTMQPKKVALVGFVQKVKVEKSEEASRTLEEYLEKTFSSESEQEMAMQVLQEWAGEVQQPPRPAQKTSPVPAKTGGGAGGSQQQPTKTGGSSSPSQKSSSVPAETCSGAGCSQQKTPTGGSSSPSQQTPTKTGGSSSPSPADPLAQHKADILANPREKLKLTEDKDFLDLIAGDKKSYAQKLADVKERVRKIKPELADNNKFVSKVYSALWDLKTKKDQAERNAAQSGSLGDPAARGALQTHSHQMATNEAYRAQVKKNQEAMQKHAAQRQEQARKANEAAQQQSTPATSKPGTAKPRAVGAISTDGASPAGSGGSTPPSSAKDKSNQNAGGNQATEDSKGGFACFPADAVVHVSDGFTVVPKKMADLQVGDSVETSSGFEEISMFLHRNDEITTTFVSLAFDDASVSNLSATHNHRIFLADGSSKQIGAVKIGDVLVHNEEAITVTAISSYDDRGIYAPMTASGSIVVNGVAASTLAQGPEGAVFQSIATMFLTPAKYLNWFFTPSAPKVANIHSAAALGTITHSQ